MEGLSLGVPFFFVVGGGMGDSGDAVVESLQAVGTAAIQRFTDP